MAWNLMEGVQVETVTENFTTNSSGTITFPAGRKIINATYGSNRVVFVRNVDPAYYATYYQDQTQIKIFDANTPYTVTYSYV